MYDRQKFFSAIRSTLPANHQLTQDQVDGMNIILAEGEKRNLDSDWLAYCLATAWWETAQTMQPVKEYGTTAYLKSKKYYPYYGRGYVQLTWDYNYKLMGNWLGIDLLNNPDLALKPDIAVKILFEGMIRGMFTAKKLSDYINGVTEDDEKEYQEYLKARAVVNGSDKASQIANYGLVFLHALTQAQTVVVAPSPASTTTTVAPGAGSLTDDPNNDPGPPMPPGPEPTPHDPTPVPSPVPVTPLPPVTRPVQPTPPPQIIVGPAPIAEPIQVDQKSLWGAFIAAFGSIVSILNILNPIAQTLVIGFVILVLLFIIYRVIFPPKVQLQGLLLKR